MLIFGYTDHEDDRLQVEMRGSEDFLTFCIPADRTNHMEGRGVHVPRDEALRLYSALGEWLYPVHTPEGPNRSLIEELIAKSVKDQVAAILPLHLRTAPVAEHRPQECPGRPECPEGDPEPRDVGHVEEPASPYQRPCDAPLKSDQPLAQVHEACGFLWALHTMKSEAAIGTEHGRLMSELSPCEGCWNGNHPHVFRPCEQPGCGCRETAPEEASSKFERPLSPETQGRLMRELLPRRTRPRTAPKCLDCLHGWGEHTGGICWGTGGEDNEGDGCRCTRERPSAAGTS